MFRTKTIVLFFVKTVVIYLVLSAPFSFYDETYGSLFRKSSEVIFKRFDQNGFLKLLPTDAPHASSLYVGNYTQIAQDGQAHCAIYKLNTRHFGYLPTILLIALILGSPVNWKRKLTSLIIGFFLISALILFKEWIYIQQICIEKPWLMLYNFSETRKTFIEHFFNSYVSPTAPSLLFTIILWILLIFKRKDFVINEIIPVKKGDVKKSS